MGEVRRKDAYATPMRIGGRTVTPHVYVRTYTIFFHVFGSIFLL